MSHRRIATCIALLVAIALVSVPVASATSLVPRNVVDLIQLSERILVGDVHTVRDGFDAGGVPYTEIGIEVDDTLKGAASATYTFRQYGLLAPKELPGGRLHVGVSPEGWPRFSEGERVVLFLYSAAEQTGLRTTVGLYQGKLTIERGLAENAIQNANLFHNVEVAGAALNAAERALLDIRSGPVDAGTLLSLVRKAIDDRWIETGVMRHAR